MTGPIVHITHDPLAVARALLADRGGRKRARAAWSHVIGCRSIHRRIVDVEPGDDVIRHHAGCFSMMICNASRSLKHGSTYFEAITDASVCLETNPDEMCPVPYRSLRCPGPPLRLHLPRQQIPLDRKHLRRHPRREPIDLPGVLLHLSRIQQHLEPARLLRQLEQALPLVLGQGRLFRQHPACVLGFSFLLPGGDFRLFARQLSLVVLVVV